MKPDCRPISLTTLMPPLLRASTRAEMRLRCASSTAVSKPKQRSIWWVKAGERAGRRAGRQGARLVHGVGQGQPRGS